LKLNGGVGGGAWFGSGTGRVGGAGDVRVGVVMKSARHGGGALLELRDGAILLKVVLGWMLDCGWMCGRCCWRKCCWRWEAGVKVGMVRVSFRLMVRGEVRVCDRLSAMVSRCQTTRLHKMDNNRVANIWVNTRYPVCYPGARQNH